MGTTLTGTTPQDTYDSLIKVTDNGPLSGTAKYLSDGLGNDSVLALSTSRVGIGTTSPSYKLDANGGLADGANDYIATFHSSTGSSGDAYVGIGAYRSDGLGSGRNAYINAVAPSGGTGNLGLQISGGNVGIGTSSPSTTLDVLGTSFLRGNVNAGKTSNINVTTAENGTGGGNREFVTFTGASATGFTGTDSSDQGYGYFPVAIVSGRSYEVSATMVVTNGSPLTFITSTGKNFATDTVQTVQSVPVSGTTYRFVASGNASYFGVAASNSGGGMTCVVSNFSLKEVGSVLVTSNSNVGVGTTAPAVPLDVVGNIRSSTGILFGSDTAAANMLDDYEEGTWTPVISGGGGNPTVTYSAFNTGGIYTKIGNQVTVSFEVRWSAISGGSGAVAIAGLPFARRTTTLPDGDRLIIDSYDNTISGKYLTGNVGSGNSSIALSMVNSAAAPTDLVVSDLSTSGLGFLRGTVTYFV